MLNETPTILVFDSGAGGLSIAKEILQLRTNCHLVYAADNAAFPYGLLDDNKLIDRVSTQIQRLLDQYQPHLVVIACNTASTLALSTLRSQFNTMFVGVVPAIKPAAAISQSRVIGILATPATITREYTDSLIAEFASGHHVYRLGSNTLVELAEKQLHGKPVSDAELQTELNNLLQLDISNSMDTIVLACTHFPLLKQRLQKLPNLMNMQWVDSGRAVARRVAHQLQTLYFNTATANSKATEFTFIYSDNNTCNDTISAYSRFLNADRPTVTILQ